MVIIVPKFTKADIAKILGERKARIESAIFNALSRIGEQFVTDARNTRTYNDVTGNLRSSIGYVILKDGKQLVSGFEKVGTKRKYGGNKGEEGVGAAKKVIAEIKVNHPKGWALIVVAGMDYASAVESGHRKSVNGFEFSVRPKDVLTNSSIKAVENLKASLFQLSKKISALE